MFDGDGERSDWSSGTKSELELLDLLAACMGDTLGRLTLRELPPVQSLCMGVPTLVAASSAPLSLPV